MNIYDGIGLSDPVPVDEIPISWRIQEIETHCPIHCPGCNACPPQIIR